ncbi:MAG: DUF4382 domain-containing protein [Candidatus Acidiferrales bacterium]|jgi:hypothetical protein
MRRANSSCRSTEVSRKVFLVALLFPLALIGCDNSCLLIVSNPGGSIGTISGSGPNCSLNTTTATFRMSVASSLSSAAEAQPRIQHVFVTLEGIEANPSASAGENSPNWQELAPHLAKEPVQLDLLARPADSCEPNISARVTVPADSYRQLRLRLSPNEAETTDPVLEQNSCGSAGFNCVVTSDGDIKPLVVDRELSQIQISSQQITGGSFRIFPDAPLNLKIEFNPQSSHFISTDSAVQLVPVFTADVQSPCESTTVADR